MAVVKTSFIMVSILFVVFIMGRDVNLLAYSLRTIWRICLKMRYDVIFSIGFNINVH